MSRSFSSTADYLRASISVLPGYPVSMSIWAYFAGTAGYQCMWLGDQGTDNGTLSIGSQSAASGQKVTALRQITDFDAGPPNFVSAASTASYAANTWHQCGLAAASATSLAAVLDGTVGATNTTASTALDFSVMDTITIARFDRTSAFGQMDGQFAHAALWTANLTAAEWAMLGAGASPLRIRPQSLVFYAPFLGRDSPEIDIVGGRTLTVTGTTASAAEPRVAWALPPRNIISGSSSATPPPPPLPPAAPSGLAATPLSSSQIKLDWTDNASNETGFKIERSLNGVSYTQIATVGANVVTYTDTGLSPSTTYYYRIRAYNAGGDSAYSAAASAATPVTPVPTERTFPQLGMYWIGSGRVQLPATYSQSGAAITVTMPNHGFSPGNSATLAFTSGGAVNGTFAVTSVTNDNVFVVTAAAPLTTSGNVNVRSSFLNQYQSATGIDAMRKRHLAVITGWPELAGFRRYQNFDIVAAVKAASTINTKVFVYYDSEGVLKTGGANLTRQNKIATQNWYVYTTGTSGTPRNSYFSSTHYAINVTDFVPPDSAGRNAMEWMADYEPSWIWGGAEGNTAGAAFDGVFVDNVLLRPRINADFNRDGVTDSSSNAIVAGWYQNGLASGATWFKANPSNSGKFMLANSADWGNSIGWGLGPLANSVYWKTFDGGVLEHAIGASFSIETFGSTAELVTYVQLTEDALLNPALGMFHAYPNSGGTTNYKDLRHAMSCCLIVCNMTFGYAESYEQSTTNFPWYDEYDFNLGKALENRKTSATQNGIWRRDFENGIVLWCPKNVTGTINLGGTFYRLTGSQDPTVNSGAAVTSVTFSSARDGLILSRAPT